MKTTSRKNPERGTQTLELALVTPLLILLGLMVCEGGAMIRTHQILNNAAREGARLSANGENDCRVVGASCLSAIQQAVVNYAANNRVTITTGDVTVDQGKMALLPSGVAVRASEVTVSSPYSLQYLPNLSYFTGSASVTLVGRAEFRNLY